MAVMDIMIRAQDRASRKFQQVARNAERAQERIDGLADTANRASRTNATIQAGVSGASRARTTLKDLMERARRMSRSKWTLPVAIVGAASAFAVLKKLKDRRDELRERKARVAVEVDGAKRVHSKLERLRNVIGRLSGKVASVRADADTAAANTKLAAVEQRADRLDGRTLRIRVARGALDRLRSLQGGLTRAANSLRAFQTVAQAVAIPGLIAGIGGLVPVLSAAAAGVYALASAITSGLVGAFAVGGTSAFGAASGLMAYTAAAKAAVGGAMLVREELREKQNAMVAERRLSILNTEATRVFNDQLDETIVALSGVQAELGNRVLPSFTRMVALLTNQLPALTPPLYRLASGVSAVAEEFARAVLTGQGLSQLQTLLNFIADSGITAARAIKNLGLGGLAAIQPLLPIARRLNQYILQATQRFNAFANSAEGQRQIAAFFQNAANKAKLLWQALGNVAAGLIGLSAAFEQSGLTSFMLNGLVRVTAQFRQFTAAGTQGRAAIVAFGQAAQPTLSAVWSFVSRLVSEWFKLSNALLIARDEMGKLVVPQAIRELERVLPLLRRLFYEAFINIGPMIGPIIQQIVKLMTTFIATNPVVIALTKSVLAAMRAFNALPTGIKTAVAVVVSALAVFKTLGTILGVLVVGKAGLAVAAIAGLTYAAVQLLGGWEVVGPRLNAIWQRIRAIFVQYGGQVVAWVRQNWPAVRQVIVSNLQQTWRIVRPLVNEMFRLIQVGARNVVTFFRNNWPQIKAIITTVFRGAQSAFQNIYLPFLEFCINNGLRLINWFKRNWPAIKSVIGSVFRGAQSFVENIYLPFVQACLNNGKRIVNWFVRNWPQIQAVIGKVFQAAKGLWNNVLKPVLSFLLQEAKVIVNWFGENWLLIQRATETVFNAIKTVISTVVKFIWGQVIRPIVNRIVSFWDRNHKDLLAIVENMWQAGKRTVDTVIRNILDIIKLVMQIITGDWEGAWNTIKRILSRTWDTIKKNIQNVLNIIKRIFNVVLTEIDNIVTNIFDAIAGFIDRRMQDVKDFISDAIDGIERIWDGLKNRLPGTVRSIFSTVGNIMKDKLEDGVNGARGVLGGLMAAIANVLGAIGMDDLAGSIDSRASKLEKPISFARGGFYQQRSVGGVADGSTPHAVYGEVGKAESYTVHGRRDNLPYAQSYLSSVGYQAVPKSRERSHAAHEMATGGVLSRGIRYFADGGQWISNAAQAASDVGSRFPLTWGPSTYAGHGADGDSRTSVDYGVAPANTVAGSRGQSIGDKITSFLLGNKKKYNLDYLIWDRMANYGGGWEQYTGGGGYAAPSNPSAWHEDHVHASFNKQGVLGRLVGGVSGAVGSAVDWLSEFADPMIDKFRNWLPKMGAGAMGGMGALSKGVSSFAKNTLVGGKDSGGAIGWLWPKITNWAKEKAASFFGGGGGNREQVAEWTRKGLQMGGRFPATDENVSAMVGRAMQESSGNPKSVNRWDSNWLAGTPSKGLYQIIRPTWNANTTSAIGGFRDNWDDPIKSAAVASRYMYSRYGRIVGSNGKGYDMGGRVPGMKGEQSLIRAHGQERVLPNNLSDSFDYYARAINRKRQQDQREASAGRPHRRAAVNISATYNIHLHEVDGKSAKQIADEIGPEIDLRTKRLIEEAQQEGEYESAGSILG